MSVKRHAIMWAVMSPDLYGGPEHNELRPRWQAHAEGDMDSDFVPEIALDAREFPPGTRVTVEVPCCPDCGLGADHPRDEPDNCECGFGWAAWVEAEFS